MGFNLNDYATVEERLALFWAAHPEGRIHTTILIDDGVRIVVRTEVYAHRDHTVPTSVGHAEEVRTKSGINALSALEVCETSSAGRALANWRYQAKKRPSRLEMEKPLRAAPQPVVQEPAEPQASAEPQPAIVSYDADELRAEIRALAKANNMHADTMRNLIATHFGRGRLLSELSFDELDKLKQLLPC